MACDHDGGAVNADPDPEKWSLVARAGGQHGRHRFCFLLPLRPSSNGRVGTIGADRPDGNVRACNG